MDLTIVTSLYQSAPHLREFHTRMKAACEDLRCSYEMVLVNDGSPDDSLAVALEIREVDPRVVIVDLSRNFGHHHALMAGIAHASGDRIFLIDCDLEEDPAWLSGFASRMAETGADVVYGVQRSRQGSPYRRLSGTAFWMVFNFLSEVKVPKNPCTVRLMSRRYAQAVLTLRDRSLFLAGNFAWAGFRQVGMDLDKTPRRSRSSYGVSRLVGLFVNAVTSFSSRPLVLAFFLGSLMSMASAGFGLVLVIRKILNPQTVLLGYASMMVTLWFLGGLVIFFLGLIGLYLARIFGEVKERPPYIVRELYPRRDGGGE
jgi:putative glycosyltransferase